VAQWYFEVWTSPNLDSGVGQPKQSATGSYTITRLRRLKAVTAECASAARHRFRLHGWARAFIRHARRRDSIDFVVDACFTPTILRRMFRQSRRIPPRRMVVSGCKKVRDEVEASPRHRRPHHLERVHARYFNEPENHRLPVMGPWLADTLRRSMGSRHDVYWTFSDVSRRKGSSSSGLSTRGFGLLRRGGIPKPRLQRIPLLHGLGTEREVDGSEHALSRSAQKLRLSLPSELSPSRSKQCADHDVIAIAHAAAVGAGCCVLDAEHGDVGGRLPPPWDSPSIRPRRSSSHVAEGLDTGRAPGDAR